MAKKWSLRMKNLLNDSIDDPTVQAAAAGDRRALREIDEARSDRVYRLMVRMVGVQDADDLTQQVYVRSFSKMSQFSADSKFETPECPQDSAALGWPPLPDC